MEKCDVAIIGGGLIGCASAFHLSKAGAGVTLIERGDLNLGASGRNAGSLHFQLEHRHAAHADHLAPSLAPLVRLSTVAIEDWSNLQLELKSNLNLVMRGGLMVAETKEDERILRRKCEIERQYGLSTEYLTGREVRGIAPYIAESVTAGALCSKEGGCNPRLVTLAFARSAAAFGARIRTGCEVQRIDRVRDGWRLHCMDSNSGNAEPYQLAADKVLVAAGAWAGEVAALANLHLPIFPIPLIMNITEEVGSFIGHLIQHVGRRLSIKQVEPGNILIGGGWPARFQRHVAGSFTQMRATPTFQAVQGNLLAAVKVVPALGDLYLIRTWAGIAGATSDQLPLLGEVKRGSRFYVAAGGSAFTFGPTYARLISETIMRGESSFPLDAYSPSRFDHLNMFMGG